MNWKTIKNCWRKEDIPVTESTINYLNVKLSAYELRGGYVEKANVQWYMDPVTDDTGVCDIETAILVKAFIHGDFGDEVEEGEELSPHWVEFHFEGPSYQGVSGEWGEYTWGDDIAHDLIHMWVYDNETIDAIFDEMTEPAQL